MKNITDTYNQKITVSYDYPVHFTHNVFNPNNHLLVDTISRLNENRRHRVQIFIDSGVARTWPNINSAITKYFNTYSDTLELVDKPVVVPGGEIAKNNRDAAERVMESIADHHLCRQSFVIIIGGGSVLDIVGLAAALVHRGVRQIRIPTTVLAQDDSGVGVKNGIDAYGVKNYAGTFAPPFGVLIDFDFLTTLDDRYWSGGIAEAFKVAIIKDAEFFDYLCKNASALKNRDEQVMEQVVRRSAIIHLDHIKNNGDPFECGTARPLDFGHWSAHKLEVMSGYELGHGHAVAIGIALDSYYAWKTDHISEEEFVKITTAFIETGLPIWSSLLERQTSNGKSEILCGLDDFQEHLGGELHITMPSPIGSKIEITKMDKNIITDAITHLKNLHLQ